MEDLENLIQKNKHIIDVYEPDENHFDRFRHKLSNKTSQYVIFQANKKNMLLLAAGFILLFSLSLLLKFSYSSAEFNHKTQLGELSNEYSEVESFYQVELNDKIKELDSLTCSQKTDNEVYNKELNDLNSEYERLQVDLSDTRYDERIVSAMITNYKMRINLVETIISSLKNYCK